MEDKDLVELIGLLSAKLNAKGMAFVLGVFEGDNAHFFHKIEEDDLYGAIGYLDELHSKLQEGEDINSTEQMPLVVLSNPDVEVDLSGFDFIGGSQDLG